jgi:hypothetical protein
MTRQIPNGEFILNLQTKTQFDWFISKILNTSACSESVTNKQTLKKSVTKTFLQFEGTGIWYKILSLSR